MKKKKQIDILSNHFQTIVVHTSTGRLETTEVIKQGKSFKNIKKYTDYNLSGLKNDHSLFFNVISSFRKIEDFEKSETQKFKFYGLNFFQRIFSGDRKKRLIKKIQEMSKDVSWIIIPNFLLSEISKIENFTLALSDEKILLGSYDNISVFLNPNIMSKEIYFGNYDSFKIIINGNNLDFDLIDKSNLKVLNLI